MRALLWAVAAWNASASASADGDEAQHIGRAVMTGHGRGERCRWSSLSSPRAPLTMQTQTRWEDVAGMMDEVAASIAETAGASSDASDAQAQGEGAHTL